MSACPNRFSVRYFRTSRLLQRLTMARQDSSHHTLLHSLAKIDLIILDDWMRDTIAVPNAQDLLALLDDRFGRSSTIVASQVPFRSGISASQLRHLPMQCSTGWCIMLID